MKRRLIIVAAAIVLPLWLSGCGAIFETQAPQVLATEPALTAPPGEAPTATLATVDLGGPPMEVGSTYMYVDGGILVAVPAGTFTMGYGGRDNPIHEVTLSDFWIYRYEVTNQQYAFCVATGQCTPPDLDDNEAYTDPRRTNDPVVGVDWGQAAGYCEFVHGRLPTEAEWEKTATWDAELQVKRNWPWGDNGPTCSLLNYNYCVGKTTPVNKYPDGQSFYGAFDISGNVYEWVADFYKPEYYTESPAQDPPGPEFGEKRSVRSSTYESGGDATIPAMRSSLKPYEHRPDLGFRCVVEDPTYFSDFCEWTLIYGMDASGSPLPGSDAVELCPNIKITMGEDCTTGPTAATPVTYVTIENDWAVPMTESVPASCVGGPGVYTCYPPGGEVSASADCKLAIPAQPGCPPGMIQVGEKCISKGKPGRCLPGFNYDPVEQCCAGTPGTVVHFKLCPAGFWYADPPGACVPFTAAGTVTESKTIPFKQSCGQPSDDDSGPCDVPHDPGCNANGGWAWDGQCGCVCTWVGRPCR
jgi:formylglycine-generating enzyme required for sulfatase activity